MITNIDKINCTIKLTEAMLGTVPKDPAIYSAYIATKAPNAEDGDQEAQTVEEIEEKGWTGFHMDDKGIFIYNYMIIGQLKAACETLIATGTIKKITAYKKWFDNLVFVDPRRLHFNVNDPDGVLERPLRTMTAKGPRVTVTRSDFMQSGRTLDFEIKILKNTKGVTMEIIKECLEFGSFVGLGQWRGSGGYGSFEIVKFK